MSCVQLGSLWMTTSASERTPWATLISAFVVSFSSSFSESWSSSLVSCVPLGSLWMPTCASERRPWATLNLFAVSSSSSLRSTSYSSRVISTAPLSFKVLAIVGISIPPLCSCCVNIFLSVNPSISPCKSFRGNSKARQHENDHFGFFRHSFTLW